MSSELPPGFNPPPTEFDPTERQRLIRVTADPTGVPVHRHKLDVEQRFEEVTTASVLEGGHQWFVLGLAYCMVKVDRSLIEAYRDALGESIKILTHQAPRPLLEVMGSEAWRANPWSATIQGIPDSHAMPFIDYISSFMFRRQDTGHDWSCGFRELVITDPFFATPRQVTCWVALPRNMTLRRRLEVTSTSLNGSIPVVSMVRETTNG